MASRLSKEYRLQILERDNFTCQFCGVGGKHSDYILEVHHVIWRRYGGSDAPHNLLTCCPVCHDLIHYGRYSGRPITFTELKNRQGGGWNILPLYQIDKILYI